MLKLKLRRLYANINLYLFEIAKLTNQRKEDVVFWIEGAANPADKLGKFDIDWDPVDKWINLANQVLAPKWLQKHPNNYLDKLLCVSKEKIKSLLQGGQSAAEPNRQESKDEDSPIESDMSAIMKDIFRNTPYNEENMTHYVCKG